MWKQHSISMSCLRNDYIPIIGKISDCIHPSKTSETEVHLMKGWGSLIQQTCSSPPTCVEITACHAGNYWACLQHLGCHKKNIYKIKIKNHLSESSMSFLTCRQGPGGCWVCLAYTVWSQNSYSVIIFLSVRWLTDCCCCWWWWW